MFSRVFIPVALATMTSAALGQGGELPLKLAPRPTVAAITAADLMTRLYIFADDSMEGRRFRTIGNVKATDYLAAEMKRLGLEPAGDDGTYFQRLPFETVTLDGKASFSIGNANFRPWEEFIAPNPGGDIRKIDGVEAVYGGRTADTASLALGSAVAGKVVIIVEDSGFSFDERRYDDAAAVLSVQAQPFDSGTIGYFKNPGATVAHPQTAARVKLRGWITKGAARAITGADLTTLAPGTSLGAVVGAPRFVHDPLVNEPPSRNVVAILRGSDPTLNQSYVAIGAHNDHVGMGGPPVDHDSTRAFAKEYARKLRVVDGQKLSPERRRAALDSIRRSIVVNVDSLRKIRPPRLDSIRNGADDDGSGSVTVLEIAEALVQLPAKPKRSILFVFHTGEEAGLYGSEYFTANPTVPRDSIVAQVNIDMVGRGSLEDTPEGGPNMVMAVGANRLSSELGRIVDEVGNRDGMRIDYAWDAPNHPQNVYYRSDHYSYARYNIPIVFFFTGLHIDYHRVTDEPQYIDYDHMSKTANYIYDVVLTLGTLPNRPVVDKKGSESR